MAKAKTKKAAAGKRAAKSAKPKEDSPQLALPMPKDRDLKHYISEYQLGKKRVDDAKAALDKITASADEAGVSVDAIKKGLAIQKKNPAQAKSDMMQLAMVLRELGTPLQVEVYEPKYGSPEAEAKVAGFQDGKAGKDRDYRSWVKGSPARRAYDENYEAGQLENMPIDAKAKAALKTAGSQQANLQ
jgi:hypothetical protein